VIGQSGPIVLPKRATRNITISTNGTISVPEGRHTTDSPAASSSSSISQSANAQKDGTSTYGAPDGVQAPRPTTMFVSIRADLEKSNVKKSSSEMSDDRGGRHLHPGRGRPATQSDMRRNGGPNFKLAERSRPETEI